MTQLLKLSTQGEPKTQHSVTYKCMVNIYTLQKKNCTSSLSLLSLHSKLYRSMTILLFQYIIILYRYPQININFLLREYNLEMKMV